MKIKCNKVMGITYLITLLSIVGILVGLQMNAHQQGEYRGTVIGIVDEDYQGVGISKVGHQTLSVKVLDGIHKGQELEVTNQLMGQVDMDNFYQVDDVLLIKVNYTQEGEIDSCYTIDLYRQGPMLILFLIFILLLLIYAKEVGVKALISFIASLLTIWMVLIPALLRGEAILAMITGTIILLTAVIVFSVAGFTKLGWSAFIGTVAGVIAMLILTLCFGEPMQLMGFTAPYAESILYRGYFHVDMKQIFYGSILLGASGAAMDIAMDVSASIKEIKEHKPEVTFEQLVKSGLSIGKAVIGTMTTTLLLAYSGGYLTLLMFFYINSTTVSRMLNMQMVSAEIMRILIGSIGLILVAPLTAVVAAAIYSKSEHEK